LRFWDPFWGTYGQRTTIILGSLENRVVDLLLALIELFSLGVTAEALRAIIGLTGAGWPKISGRIKGVALPPTILLLSKLG